MIRWLCIAMALAVGSASVSAQEDGWSRLVAESDSVGPVTPQAAPSRRLDCGLNSAPADSVEVRGGSGEFLLARYSLRTRGMFNYVEPPAGAGRFALKAIVCHEKGSHPFTFIMERDDRYFYAVYSLAERPTYSELRFRSPTGEWRAYRWNATGRTLAP